MSEKNRNLSRHGCANSIQTWNDFVPPKVHSLVYVGFSLQWGPGETFGGRLHDLAKMINRFLCMHIVLK